MSKDILGVRGWVLKIETSLFFIVHFSLQITLVEKMVKNSWERKADQAQEN